jgi:hypothetical protein
MGNPKTRRACYTTALADAGPATAREYPATPFGRFLNNRHWEHQMLIYSKYGAGLQDSADRTRYNPDCLYIYC